ncbi:hypothetical protein NM688_g3984 [Phlebia brevispora]|uniref:Uncharacterized protein n=1 Tax=Phlebia brevispora TaxID=194682 RepID=A0ACC1T471_9APHY|nr:hypothetical protein NM688_g3984 [Phlebia brevispora]
MALTVLSTSGLPRDPAWDESIVPALRKRLEHESQALSKRMSAASMERSIIDDYTDTFASNAAFPPRDRADTPSSQNIKPSAIPRPSLQHARTADYSPNESVTSSQLGSMTRSRTFSQPFPFDSPPVNGASYSPPSVASRSTSPMSPNIKSTRIPVSRARTGSTSSYRPRADSRADSYKANGYVKQFTPQPMPAVFPASYSRGLYDEDLTLGRRSSDSEERPFEHWYRGDVSRNGGVGELRIGRKQEMLDIANYGHALREESSRSQLGSSSRSRSNSRGHEGPHPYLNRRPRSGSVGTPGRASIYIDPQQLPDDSMVLDEQPLTDLDSDEEQYGNGDVEGDYMDEDITTHMGYDRENGASPPLSADRSDTPTTLVDLSKNSNFKSRLPTPARQAYESPETPTPTQSPTLNAVDAPPVPPKDIPAVRSIPSSPSATPKASPGGAASNTKRRAKSPAAASVNGKKPRTRSPAKVPPKKTRENEERRSVAQYPTPEGDDISHAIPTWTQPVPANGNWDDVVLPVVARKKGLEGQYQQVDGSPRPQPTTRDVVEPAPGTFGYDASKYRRPPRRSTDPEDIPMDEFGQRKDTIDTVPEEPPQRSPLLPSPSPLPSPNPPLRSPDTHGVSPTILTVYAHARACPADTGYKTIFRCATG